MSSEIPRIYDISPLLSPTTAVFPGDVPLARDVMLQIQDGHPIELSALRCTVHLGAHADAPSHFIAGAPSIEAADLQLYLGRCRVVSHIGPQPITATTLAPLLPEDIPQRVLIKTLSQPDPEVFNLDFAYFMPDAIRMLADRGVRLVGIDTASLDHPDSKDLAAHHELFRCGLRNLECLSLEHVPDGEYELIALPLRLAGFEASPLRAILRG